MTTVDIQPLPNRPAAGWPRSSPTSCSRPSTSSVPGCGHPIAWRLVLDALVELELSRRTILIAGHGCYTQMMKISDLDSLQCLHGRAPAVATGVKRMVPDAAVVTLQGDGDMVSEGLHEVLHAAARAENVTALLFNNGVFGDTGGHMTATTCSGSGPRPAWRGATPPTHGYPIDVARLLTQIEGAAYVARGAVNTPGMIARTQADDPPGARAADGRRRLHLRRGADHVPDRVVRPDRQRTGVPGGLHDGDLRHRRAQDALRVGAAGAAACRCRCRFAFQRPAPSAEVETHRECLGAADQCGVHERGVAVQLNRVEPTDQLPEEGADLHAGQLGPQAEVAPEPEGKV